MFDGVFEAVSEGMLFLFDVATTRRPLARRGRRFKASRDVDVVLALSMTSVLACTIPAGAVVRVVQEALLGEGDVGLILEDSDAIAVPAADRAALTAQAYSLRMSVSSLRDGFVAMS